MTPSGSPVDRRALREKAEALRDARAKRTEAARGYMDPKPGHEARYIAAASEFERARREFCKVADVPDAIEVTVLDLLDQIDALEKVCEVADGASEDEIAESERLQRENERLRPALEQAGGYIEGLLHMGIVKSGGTIVLEGIRAALSPSPLEETR